VFVSACLDIRLWAQWTASRRRKVDVESRLSRWGLRAVVPRCIFSGKRGAKGVAAAASVVTFEPQHDLLSSAEDSDDGAEQTAAAASCCRRVS
jgi:hypothetical protein